MVINQIELTQTVLLLPLIFIEVYLFSLGATLFLSAAFVKYRDVGYIWDVVLQAGFYLTPILYPLTLITNETFQKLIMINPMAQAIQDARYAAVTELSPTISSVFDGGLYQLIPYSIVILTLVGGLFYFRKESKYFAENI